MQKSICFYLSFSFVLSILTPASIHSQEASANIVVTNTGKGEVIKFSKDRKELWKLGGFKYPTGLSIYQKDKSVWIADNYNNQVVKLSSDGKELLRLNGFKKPRSLEVDQSDGSVWVADYLNAQVVKLTAEGKEALRIKSGMKSPYHLSIYQKDGSVWVADFYARELVKFSRDGEELKRININGQPCHTAIDEFDGSVLAACAVNGQKVVRISREGRIIQEIPKPECMGAQRVFVDNNSRDFWIFSSDKDGWIVKISRFDKDGKELINLGHYNTMDVDPKGFSSLLGGRVMPDGTILVADAYGNDRVIHLSKEGRFLKTFDNLSSVMAIDIEE